METISYKVSVLQNGLSYGRLPISFSNIVLWLLPNIEQKGIPLNDNIIWLKKVSSFQISCLTKFQC